MCPWMTYIALPYNIVVLFMSPQLLHQYLMQGFDTCYTVTCIEHVHEEMEFLSMTLLQYYIPLNMKVTCMFTFFIALATSFIN